MRESGELASSAGAIPEYDGAGTSCLGEKSTVSMLRESGLMLILAALLCAPGCAGSRQDLRPYRPPCQKAVVFAVDGAGGFHAPTQAMRETVMAEGLPIGVEVVEWTHGYGRVFMDHLDYAHVRCMGQQLAGHICAWQQAHPGMDVDIVGHSAGCAVVLAAAEFLPPCALDHIVLLAPSISADYDLRPALRSVRKSLDVFHSCRDQVLFFGTIFTGTTDRQWPGPVAGRTGFFPCPCSFEDTVLYQKLRQHAWQREQRAAGHRGGHYGGYQPAFLRASVLPILME